MLRCPTCGARFDERRYQILAPGLGSFDRIDCALAALERPAPSRGRGTRRLRLVHGG